jgi:hypothetical protein
MKKFLLFFVMLGSLLAYGQTPEEAKWDKLDVKYGFKDIKFEMSEAEVLAKVKSVQLDTKEPGLKKYKVLDAKYLNVGDCELSLVAFNFFDGKLMSINILTKGDLNFRCLLNSLNTQFGTAFKDNEYIERYSWIGKKVFAMYEQNSINYSGDFYMNSTSMSDKYTEFNKNRDKKNGSDF